jgi:hypothetical protein
MADFFISYTQADRSWAEWIAWHLEAMGYTTVIQAWDFRPGSNFVLDMQRAAEAQRTIAVLSPAYLAAAYTQPEWAAALAQDPQGVHGTLLPVRVRDCAMPNLLRALVYIDLVGLEEAAATDALVAGINRTRAKPSVPPGFPGTTTVTSAASPAPPYPTPPMTPTTGSVTVSGGIVYGPVVGTNQGAITTTYHQDESHGRTSPPSGADAADQRTS